MAGEKIFVRHFPFNIGRAPHSDLRLEDSGVWDDHLNIKFNRKEGYILKAAPTAFCAVNDAPQNSTRLHNGDVISFGSVKLQFWLAPARLRGLKLRELFVWLLLLGVTVAQIAVVMKLLR
jgi:predicted component of type VI protein secretion system